MRQAVSSIGVFGALALGLVACSEPSPEPGSELTLEVGDCFQDEDMEAAAEITEVPLVDCEEPHDNEVFAVVELPGGDYPEDIPDQAQDHCQGELFTGYVGAPYQLAGLTPLAFWPSEEGWGEGHREIVCYLFREDLDPMIGSQQGAGVVG